MTLRLMLQKGVITEAEYESALRDSADSMGLKAAETNSLVIGKWSATLYGFAEADYMFDSTQSYSDLAGSAQVAHPGTYAANNPRSQFSIRNSRVGFRFRAPEYHAIRSSADIEPRLPGRLGQSDLHRRDRATDREPVLHQPRPAHPPRLPEDRDARRRRPLRSDLAPVRLAVHLPA